MQDWRETLLNMNYNVSVLCFQVAQNGSSNRQLIQGVDNPTYPASNFHPQLRPLPLSEERDILESDSGQPYFRPSEYKGYHQYDRLEVKEDFPFRPEAERHNRKEKHVRPLYAFDYNDNESKPKSRRKRVIIAVVVVTILFVVAAAAVALTLTLIKEGEL